MHERHTRLTDYFINTARLPSAMKGILSMHKIDLFEVRNTDFWAAYGSYGEKLSRLASKHFE